MVEIPKKYEYIDFDDDVVTKATKDDKKLFCCSGKPWTFGTKNHSKVCKDCGPFEFKDRRKKLFLQFLKAIRFNLAVIF